MRRWRRVSHRGFSVGLIAFLLVSVLQLSLFASEPHRWESAPAEYLRQGDDLDAPVSLRETADDALPLVDALPNSDDVAGAPVGSDDAALRYAGAGIATRHVVVPDGGDNEDVGIHRFPADIPDKTNVVIHNCCGTEGCTVCHGCDPCRCRFCLERETCFCGCECGGTCLEGPCCEHCDCYGPVHPEPPSACTCGCRCGRPCSEEEPCCESCRCYLWETPDCECGCECTVPCSESAPCCESCDCYPCTCGCACGRPCLEDGPCCENCGCHLPEPPACTCGCACGRPCLEDEPCCESCGCHLPEPPACTCGCVCGRPCLEDEPCCEDCGCYNGDTDGIERSLRDRSSGSGRSVRDSQFVRRAAQEERQEQAEEEIEEAQVPADVQAPPAPTQAYLPASIDLPGDGPPAESAPMTPARAPQSNPTIAVGETRPAEDSDLPGFGGTDTQPASAAGPDTPLTTSPEVRVDTRAAGPARSTVMMGLGVAFAAGGALQPLCSRLHTRHMLKKARQLWK